MLQEDNGGAGASDHLTACLVAEELAAADTGTAYYFMLTARRARDWFELRMTPEQRDYFLPKFLSDDTYFTTVAIHEPDTDLASITSPKPLRPRASAPGPSNSRTVPG